jgi:FkbM family methyltransferase
MSSLTSKVFGKIRIQIEDIVWQKSLRNTAAIALNVAYRRGLPMPSAVYNFFTKTGKTEADELGDEDFLAPYMLPAEGKCLVDVGASVGLWSIWAARQNREVYCFEPSPKAFVVLKNRTRPYPNIHAYPYALGEKDTTGRLGLAAFSLSGSMDVELKGIHKGGTIDIAVRSLDSLDIPHVGVLKIDTEGYEIPILQGAKNTIQKQKPRLIVEVHRDTGKAAKTFPEELERVKRVLRDYGYVWRVHGRQVSLRELQPHVISDPAL